MDTKRDLPLGFGMALAQNTAAMKSFCNMKPDRQREVIAHTHQIKSKQEMQDYVASLGSVNG